jgi:hypothetical protein
VDYIESFKNEDRELIFRLFATFSRFEYSLKRSRRFVRSDRNVAKASWDDYAKSISAKLSGITDPTFLKARKCLLERPPQRLELGGDGEVRWSPISGTGKTDAECLLRIVRDVRNNLFHGGKYLGGPTADLARDRELISSSIAVLKACLPLDAHVHSLFSDMA